ncbi:uncharacterized protein [Acropora muricata]|uniref:uncharacterized protein n=1 Tax=Acropora muricata TaxID=159855 RepID=UPI0034E59236
MWKPVHCQRKLLIVLLRVYTKTFCRHGAPAHIVTDQGREFVNQIAERLNSKYNINHRITSAYNSQSNGLDERTNQTVKKTLRKLTANKDEDWEDYLNGVLFAINTNTSTTTKYSPFFLMYGRNPVFPMESEVQSMQPLPSFTDDELELQLSRHVKAMNQLRDQIFPKVSENINHAQEKQRQQFQRRKGNISCPFQNKDMVLRRNMLQKTKMGHKTEDNWLGPYEVVDLDENKGTCKLQNQKTGQIIKRRVPLKQLKPYISPESTSEIGNTNNPIDHLIKSEDHTTTKNKDADEDTVPDAKPEDTHDIPKTKSEDCTSTSSLAHNGQDRDFELGDGQSLSSCSCPSTDDDADMHLATDLERVASLTEEDLERQMSNIEQELTDIYSGKVINWREELLEKGNCQQYPYLKKQDLAYNAHVASFTDEQLNIVLSSIQEIFPKANLDIATKVLIPEACLLIVRDVLSIPYSEAEKFVCNPQHYHLPSLKRRGGSTDDSKVLTKKQKVHKYSTPSSPTHDECVINYEGTAYYDGTVPFKDTVPRNRWLAISNTRSSWTVSTYS